MLRGKAYLSKVRFNRLFASQSSSTNCRSPSSIYLRIRLKVERHPCVTAKFWKCFIYLQNAWKVGLNDENRMMGKPAQPTQLWEKPNNRPTADRFFLPAAFPCLTPNNFVKVHHRWKKKSLRASVKSDATALSVQYRWPQHHTYFQQCSPSSWGRPKRQKTIPNSSRELVCTYLHTQIIIRIYFHIFQQLISNSQFTVLLTLNYQSYPYINSCEHMY